jgi:hypothetical protein
MAGMEMALPIQGTLVFLWALSRMSGLESLVKATLSIEHLTQFVQLWALIQNLHLNDIKWKLTGNGQLILGDFRLQVAIFGLMESNMNSFGKLGKRRKRRTTHGWFCKIGFRR